MQPDMFVPWPSMVSNLIIFVVKAIRENNRALYSYLNTNPGHHISQYCFLLLKHFTLPILIDLLSVYSFLRSFVKHMHHPSLNMSISVLRVPSSYIIK